MIMMQNSVMTRYTLDNFKEICQNGFNYHINDETLEIISALSAQVGAPDYIKTPNFNSTSVGFTNGNGSGSGNGIGRDRNRQGGRRRRKQQEMSDEDWEDLRSFHSKPKAALSPEKVVEKKYRGELNKVVSGFSEEQMIQIVSLFNEYKELKNDDSPESLFFDTATCSKMNTDLFSELLCDMIQHDNNIDDNFIDAIPKLIERWLHSFNDITCINEDEDYDKFCDFNRINEKRLNTSRFLGNFFKKVFQSNNMENYHLFKIINEALNTIFDKFDDELMIKDNEDVAFACCNNLFSFFIPILDIVSVDPDNFSDLSVIEDVKSKIMDIVNYENEEYKSLTRKIIFTIQDHKIWL